MIKSNARESTCVGFLPYMFGYVASGYIIDLLCLYKNPSSGGTSVCSRVIGRFDLSSAEERFRFVLALLNVCQLFRRLAAMCPSSGRDEYEDVKGQSGVSVRLNSTCIDKIFPTETGFDRLEQIYGIMKNASVPNVDCLVKINRATKTAVFEPRGVYNRRRHEELGFGPLELLHLFIALRNVLEALIILHRESVMHRDIRWPNVIQRCDRVEWFLIDFSDAATSPQHFPDGSHLCPNEHAPEMFEPDSIHATPVDIGQWEI